MVGGGGGSAGPNGSVEGLDMLGLDLGLDVLSPALAWNTNLSHSEKDKMVGKGLNELATFSWACLKILHVYEASQPCGHTKPHSQN